MKLKVFNLGYNRGTDHLNVCASSRRAAARMISEWEGHHPEDCYFIGILDRDIQDYGSDCWGNDMKGIKPEEGIWIVRDQYSKGAHVERVWPKKKVLK